MGIEAAVWRALAVFRVLGLAYAVAVYLRRYDEYTHPVSGWVVLAMMATWTVVVTRLYDARLGQRRRVVLSVDLVLAVAAVLASRWLDDPARIADGAQTLPVVWASAPVLAWAIWGGWRAGLVAAVVVSAADLAHRGAATVATVNNIVLLLLAGTVIGYTVDLARRGEAALARALAVEAASRERDRLSRTIHDGVLQVLAMVGRRGQEAGGEAAELGRLAAEQEQALRSLVSGTSLPYGDSTTLGDGARPSSHRHHADPDADVNPGHANRDADPGHAGRDTHPGRVDPDTDGPGVATDLRALLTAYASSSVTVSTPATPVLLARTAARELAAAVGAALANVESHAGPTARAWVLVEQDGSEVVVSIRDDGPGFAPGRLTEARLQGRLGVASSITGRVRDLGGTVTVESAPGLGTEVELRVPATGPDAGRPRTTRRTRRPRRSRT